MRPYWLKHPMAPLIVCMNCLVELLQSISIFVVFHFTPIVPMSGFVGAAVGAVVVGTIGTSVPNSPSTLPSENVSSATLMMAKPKAMPFAKRSRTVDSDDVGECAFESERIVTNENNKHIRRELESTS